MRRDTYSLLLAASIIPFSATLSQANAAIVNGDFGTFVPSNGTGGGWTTSHIDGAGGWLYVGGSHGYVFALNEAADPNSDPTIAQTVSGLTIGTTYRVEGEYSTLWVGGTGAVGFAAGYGSTVGFEAGPTVSWQPFSFEFTPTGTSEQIWIKGEYARTDYDFMVDNISISMIAVPEPSTYLAGLSALGMLGLFGWRNRK